MTTPEIKELLKAVRKIDNLYSPGLYNAKLLKKAKKKYPKLFEEYKNYYLELYQIILRSEKKLKRVRRIGTKFWDTIDVS